RSGTTAAAAKRDRLAAPVLDAAVEDRTCVDACGGEDARRDRCPRPRLADRHDGLARVEAVRSGLAQQAVGDVQRAGDVALVALRFLAHVEHLHGPLLE